MEADNDRAAEVQRMRQQMELFEAIIRAQREWPEILRIVADAPTVEDAERRLVAEMGFSELEAHYVGFVQFRLLVGKAKAQYIRDVDELRRALGATEND